jgi:hypothetical protein
MCWFRDNLERYAVAFALGAAIAGTLAWKLPLARQGKMLSDCPVYLDIARHISAGEGPILSVNFYQDWAGRSTPAVPYQHIGFAWWIVAVWAINHSVAAVSVANALLSSLSILIYYVLCRIFFSRLVSLTSAIVVALSNSLLVTSVLPHAEQLQFLFLLLALLLLWRPRLPAWAAALAGLLFAANFLVRVASVYSYAATCAAERRRAFYAASLLALGAWELFCWTQYGKFYPQYPEGARVFSVATYYPGGYYSDVPPLLRLREDGLGFRARRTLENAPVNLARFYGALVVWSGWALAALPLLATRLRFARLRAISRGSRLFLLQGLAPLFGYCLTFYWLDRLESRYLLWVLPFVLPPFLEALLGLRWLAARRVRFAVVGLVLAVALLRGGLFMAAEPGVPWRLSGVQMPRQWAYEQVRTHSKPGDIVAINELGYMYELERPAVSLPRGCLMNEKNIRDFLRIYNPSWIVIARIVLFAPEAWNPMYNRLLEEAGYRQVYSNYGYWIYARPGK